MADAEEKEVVNVFGKKFTGGPKNLGDPDDKTLRHVEEYIFITNMIRDRAHHEKCKDQIKEWGTCMEDNSYGLKGIFSFFTCKKYVDAMNNCLVHYFKDNELKAECEKIYLERRTKYRETGIIEKDPYYKKPYYESERKKEYVDKFRKKKQEENLGESSNK